MAAARHSLFFALLPPTELAEQVANATVAWRQSLGLSGQPMEPGRLHLTLLWIAPEASSATVSALSEVADRVRQPPVPVRLDRLGRFDRGEGRSCPVVLCSSSPSSLRGLQTLQEDLANRARVAGFPVRVRAGFEPHMTLLYDRHPLVAQPAGPFAWTAHDFVLIHSFIGERRHEVLGRWPLSGVAA